MSAYTREPPAALRWRCDCGTTNTGPVDQKCDTCLSYHPSVAERFAPIPPEESETPIMATKNCARSGKAFTPSGNNQKFCGTCADCQTPSAKAKAEKPEKKRPRVDTGYRPTIQNGQKPSKGEDYTDAIERIEGELAGIDARKRALQSALDSLRLLVA